MLIQLPLVEALALKFCHVAEFRHIVLILSFLQSSVKDNPLQRVGSRQLCRWQEEGVRQVLSGFFILRQS